jgi:hypothetical protein
VNRRRHKWRRPQQDKMGFYDLSYVDLASGTTAVILVEDPQVIE